MIIFSILLFSVFKGLLWLVFYFDFLDLSFLDFLVFDLTVADFFNTVGDVPDY